MQLTDFDFTLPESLIASTPLAKRSASKLMCVLRDQTISHRHFYNLIDLVEPGDLFVFNDTKVIPARLYARKQTGGSVEILIERILDESRALVQLRVSKAPRMGDHLLLTDDVHLVVVARQQQFYELLDPSRNIFKLIQTLGHVPLPHYMHRHADEIDKSRYQTIYAKHDGSVAAPTAGLHFDQTVMQQLADKQVEFAYLTLHIGAGTFAPIRTTEISAHQMHTECFTISPHTCAQIKTAKADGRRVIAVGTTTMRALESASLSGEINPTVAGETQIFIYPGFQFRCADVLITNFHLPRSSLLLLVCAFAGTKTILSAYQEAIRNDYRFYSYGDAMWLASSLV